MHVADWLPTIVEGIAKRQLVSPSTLRLDGMNVFPALVANTSSPRREALLQLSGPVNGSWCNPNPGYFKPKHDNDLICGHQLSAAYRRGPWKVVVQEEEDPYFSNSSSNVSGVSNLLGHATGWVQMVGDHRSYEAPTKAQSCWDTVCLFNLEEDPLETRNVAAVRTILTL